MSASARINLVGPLNVGTGSRALLGIRVDGPALLPVVLLPVPRKTLDDPEALLRLRKETDRAVSLDHPSILAVLGLVPMKRGLARATAYANGEPLRRILTRAVRLSPAMACRVIADAATGAHYAHLAANEEGTPLVHGDLRPETVMSSYSGVSLVTGYGALTVAPTEAGGKRVPGRRRYSAPEQILGGRTAITPQTDVFLLGLMLWESLTGTVPFFDSPDPDRAIVSQELALDSKYIPEKLRAVLACATMKKGTDRYPTALAFREAIEGAVELATREQYAQWLEAQFVGDPITLSQRKLVAKALEDAQGVAQTPPPLPKTTETSTAEPSPTPIVVPAPKPKPRPVERPRRAVRIEEPEPEEAPRTATWPIALAAAIALVVGAAGGWWARDLQEPTRSERTVVDNSVLPPQTTPKVEFHTPDPPPEEPILVVAQPPNPNPTPGPAAPAPTEPAPPRPAVAVVPIPSGESATGVIPGVVLPTLDLYSVPEVDALIGTRSLGRTPVSATLLAGKHVLTLVNASLGIRVTREVEVNPTGSTHVEVRIGVGSLGFHAPAGARVFVDKKLIGVAPIDRRIPIYEGAHHAVVEVGDQKWEETFQVADGDWLSYTAHPDARQRGGADGAPLRFTREVSGDSKPEIAVP